MKHFITDAGGPVTLNRQGRNDAGEIVTDETINIGRYGVWEAPKDESPSCIDTGDDLEALQAEYGPGLTIYQLPGVGSDAESKE